MSILSTPTCAFFFFFSFFFLSVFFLFPVSLTSLPHQRQAKYSENKLKVMKARNEYLLTLEAANAALFKYYIQDLSHLIDVSIKNSADLV